MIQCLIHPSTCQIVAELTPEKEVIIHDKAMLKSLISNGITVSSTFKTTLNLTGWRVYPGDDKEVFAKAFKQFYFIHGLQQQGYTWESKGKEISIEESVKAVLY